METDAKIECSLFEYAGDFKVVQYNDSAKIVEFINKTKTLKKDTIEYYQPDVRAKIILQTKSGKTDIICISNFGICYNNTPMLMKYKYLDYIKSLIKARDKEFEF